MPEKKKFWNRVRDTKFAGFLRDKVKPVAGDVLEIVGDLTGVEAIERVGEMLNDRKEQNAEMEKLMIEFNRYKLEFELEMHRADMNAEIEMVKAEVADRTSAREREAKFMEFTKGKRDWLMAAVIITGLLLLIGVIIALVFVSIPDENQRLADMAFGAIMSIGASIFSYYVGSSRASRFKDETIHEFTKKN